MVGGQISHCRWPFLILGQNNGKKYTVSKFSRIFLVRISSRTCLISKFLITWMSRIVSIHISRYSNFLDSSRCTPLESQFVSNGVNLNFNCLDLSRYLSHFLIISRSRLVSTKIRLDPSLLFWMTLWKKRRNSKKGHLEMCPQQLAIIYSLKKKQFFNTILYDLYTQCAHSFKKC